MFTKQPGLAPAKIKEPGIITDAPDAEPMATITDRQGMGILIV